MNEKLSATVHVKLTPSERKALDILAQQNQRTLSDTVRRILQPKLRQVKITEIAPQDDRLDVIGTVLSADERELLNVKAVQSNRTPADYMRIKTLELIQDDNAAPVPDLKIKRSKRFSIRLNKIEHQALKEFAERHNISVHETLRMCIYA